MSLGAPSAPTPPDPAATSAAQTQSNKETALYNFGLNNPNYNTPLGGISYNVSNTTPQYDNAGYQRALDAWNASQSTANSSNGGPQHSIPGHNSTTPGNSSPMPKLSDFITNAGGNPHVDANVTLSPEQQQLYDNQTQQSIGLSNLANQLQSRVGTSLDQPLPTQNDINSISQNAQDAYYNNQRRYLDPQFQQGQQQLDAKLANQGITMGSEAYNNDQNNFARQKQSAYDTAQNNAILQGPQNAQQLFALTAEQRSQPLNELNALRTGSQVSMPQVPGQTPSNAAPTDVSGNINNAYAQQMGAYNAQMGASNSLTSGLFGLGGSLGSAAIMASDRRLKTNIERIGETKSGIPVYRYKYRGSDHLHMGVMSDEVRHIPGAVIQVPGGWDMVDYRRLR